MMIVPIVVAGMNEGALTLVSAESGRRYDEQDLELAFDRPLAASTLTLAHADARACSADPLLQALAEQGIEIREVDGTNERDVEARGKRALGAVVARRREGDRDVGPGLAEVAHDLGSERELQGDEHGVDALLADHRLRPLGGMHDHHRIAALHESEPQQRDVQLPIVDDQNERS